MRPGSPNRLTRAVRFLSIPGARMGAAVILLVLAAFFVPQMYRRAARPGGNDLTVYLASGQALLHGGDPYAIALPQGHAPYPLTIDTLLIPLSWMPMWLAQAIWFVANGVALVISLKLLERLWNRGPGEVSLVATVPFIVRLAVLALALLTPFQSQFALGQMDLVVLGLCCLFCHADLTWRRSRSAFWLGGAIAMKLTPGIFAAGLLVRRQARTVALTLGWVALWAIALPALASTRVMALYEHGWARVLRSHVGAPPTLQASHFTLAGLLSELWPASASIPGLRYWATVAVLAPILLIEWRVPLYPRGRLLLFAAGLVAIPLISPISETHHLTLLAAPLWLWALAAGTPPFAIADLVGAALFLAGHWLALALAGPAATRRWSVFDALALIVLYVVLLGRVWRYRLAAAAEA